MSSLINLNVSPHPDHDGINSYGIKCVVQTKKKVGTDMIREFASDLLKSISAQCVRLGAIDIGHIKAYIEFENGFLYADTVGEQAEVVIKGKGDTMISEFSITLNSVIVGISESAIKEATQEMLDRALQSLDFIRKTIQNAQVSHE